MQSDSLHLTYAILGMVSESENSRLSIKLTMNATQPDSDHPKMMYDKVWDYSKVMDSIMRESNDKLRTIVQNKHQSTSKQTIS
jgi:hypothetical protein